MSSVNIFTRYEQDENCFTNGLSSILRLATLESAEFLSSFLRDTLNLAPTGTLNVFRVLKEIKGTADGEISGDDCCIHFETKIASGSLRCEQVDAHLQRLVRPSDRLVLLTPDDSNSKYTEQFLSRDSMKRVLHLGWKRVYDFLDSSVRGNQFSSLFSELVRQFLDRIHDKVFEQDYAGIIMKIDFGPGSGVYADCYLDEMRDGKWTKWNTPRQYKKLDETGRKLMLYDRTRQEITVEVEIERVERTNLEIEYPWTNVFAQGALIVLPEPIPLGRIRGVKGFEQFGEGRSAIRNITHEQHRKLTAR